MGSFCDSFHAANSYRAGCYTTGLPADDIHCESRSALHSTTVDLHLLAADNFFLQQKLLQTRSSSLVEHSLTSISNKGSIGAVVLLQRPPAPPRPPPCSTSATRQVLGSMVQDAGGEWEQYVMDHTKGCLRQYTGGAMSSLLSTSTSSLGRYTPQITCSGGSRAYDHIREGTMMRELIDGNNNLGVPPLQGVSISLQEPAAGHHMVKLLHHGSSCSTDPRGDLTGDSSKFGGLALQAGVDLATSHCLVSGLSSDPGFAEQTSSLGSGGEYPTQAHQPIFLLTDSPESRSRAGEAGQLQAHESSHGNLSRTSSTIGIKIDAGVSLDITTRANAIPQQLLQAGRTQVCAVSDDESKEPCGTGSSLPTSLEAFEGVKESSVADEAAGLANSDGPGIARINAMSRGATTISIAPEKKRKNVVTPDDWDHGSSSLCQESTILQADENHGTKPKRLKLGNGAAPRKSSSTDEAQKRSPRQLAEVGSCNDNSDNDSSQDMSKEMVNPARKLQPHVDLSKQDYIHVRARRGQATDSHSLAERVRREKINERMKYLQDLVPGCSKVTGKAVMLDEIINYVQLLQRQVENLSMKLASVDHSSSLLNQAQCHANLQQKQRPTLAASFQPGVLGACTALDSRHDSFLNANLERGSSHGCVPTTTELLQGSCISSANETAVAIDQGCVIQRSASSVLDGSDLQSIVQMGILQCGPTTSMRSQACLKCHVPIGHMKVEL